MLLFFQRLQMLVLLILLCLQRMWIFLDLSTISYLSHQPLHLQSLVFQLCLLSIVLLLSLQILVLSIFKPLHAMLLGLRFFLPQTSLQEAFIFIFHHKFILQLLLQPLLSPAFLALSFLLLQLISILLWMQLSSQLFIWILIWMPFQILVYHLTNALLRQALFLSYLVHFITSP